MTEFPIHAQDLKLARDGREILRGLTLAVPQGAVVGLVGRNGAGKSTLLRCLTGLAAPDSGRASLLGCPSLDLSDAVRERLGYVAQTPDLFEWMTVREHLATIGRAYANWSEDRSLTLALRLELPLETKVRDLSGGDQQKLSVVLALAHHPDVLLLDEPVASLDPLTRREFMRSLFSSVETERTIIISSHILSDLERVASHIAFIRDGQLQAFDAWDDMLEHYRVAPPGSAVPPAAVIWRGAGHHALIDTRRAPALAQGTRPFTLDELFVELNT